MRLALPAGPKCANCGGVVFHERTRDGSIVPIDAEPVPDGKYEIRRGLLVLVSAGTLELPLDGESPSGNRYSDHRETCKAQKQPEVRVLDDVPSEE